MIIKKKPVFFSPETAATAPPAPVTTLQSRLTTLQAVEARALAAFLALVLPLITSSM